MQSSLGHAQQLRTQWGAHKQCSRHNRSMMHVRAAASASPSADYRRDAAQQLVDKYVRENMVVGLGSGPLVVAATEVLGEKVAMGRLQIVAVPTCGIAAHEAAFHGVPLCALEDRPQVDMLIDEAEQLDIEGNAYIKGSRTQPTQPELLQMSRVLQASEKLVLLADSRNVVPKLSISLPVVIDGENWEEPAEELDDLFLGDAEVWRRPSSGTDNPRGGDNPYVSPEGHNIVDVRFYESYKLVWGSGIHSCKVGEMADYDRIAAAIESIPGVYAHGLVVGCASAVAVASPESGTTIKELHVQQQPQPAATQSA